MPERPLYGQPPAPRTQKSREPYGGGKVDYSTGDPGGLWREPGPGAYSRISRTPITFNRDMGGDQGRYYPTMGGMSIYPDEDPMYTNQTIAHEEMHALDRVGGRDGYYYMSDRSIVPMPPTMQKAAGRGYMSESYIQSPTERLAWSLEDPEPYQSAGIEAIRYMNPEAQARARQMDRVRRMYNAARRHQEGSR